MARLAAQQSLYLVLEDEEHACEELQEESRQLQGTLRTAAHLGQHLVRRNDELQQEHESLQEAMEQGRGILVDDAMVWEPSAGSSSDDYSITFKGLARRSSVCVDHVAQHTEINHLRALLASLERERRDLKVQADLAQMAQGAKKTSAQDTTAMRCARVANAALNRISETRFREARDAEQTTNAEILGRMRKLEEDVAAFSRDHDEKEAHLEAELLFMDDDVGFHAAQGLGRRAMAEVEEVREEADGERDRADGLLAEAGSLRARLGEYEADSAELAAENAALRLQERDRRETVRLGDGLGLEAAEARRLSAATAKHTLGLEDLERTTGAQSKVAKQLAEAESTNSELRTLLARTEAEAEASRLGLRHEEDTADARAEPRAEPRGKAPV